MNLQKAALFLCGLLLLLWDVNAQSCTSGATSPPASGDPHYYNLCSNGAEVLTECPSSTLYVQATTNVTACLATYGGCSQTVAGCVSCQDFPWPGAAGTLTAPACSAVGPVAPYCDPSYYWFCTSIYGTAELRECPSGDGFSTLRIFGCVDWYNWNTS